MIDIRTWWTEIPEFRHPDAGVRQPSGLPVLHLSSNGDRDRWLLRGAMGRQRPGQVPDYRRHSNGGDAPAMRGGETGQPDALPVRGKAADERAANFAFGEASRLNFLFMDSR